MQNFLDIHVEFSISNVVLKLAIIAPPQAHPTIGRQKHVTDADKPRLLPRLIQSRGGDLSNCPCQVMMSQNSFGKTRTANKCVAWKRFLSVTLKGRPHRTRQFLF